MAKQGTRKRVTRSRTAANVATLKVSRESRPTVYVAVVVRGGFATYPYSSKYASNRNDDGWFALMGEDKEKLIEEAMGKAKSFGGHRSYEVAVGVLDEMVVVPTNYKLVKL